MSYVIHKKVVVPDENDLYFVGDIHGCFDLYKSGLRELGIKPSDYVISVGDLIDRGTENFKCVEHFHNKPNRFAVLGNHEWMMVEGVLHGNEDWKYCWLDNGGEATFNELGYEGLVPLSTMVKDFPVILEVHHRGKVFGVVHGGVPLRYENRGLDYAETSFRDLINNAQYNSQELFNMIWDRDTLEAGQYHARRNEMLPYVSGVDAIFHGHSYVEDMTIFVNRVYIDTGSVFNNKICFAWVNEEGSLESYRTGDNNDL